MEREDQDLEEVIKQLRLEIAQAKAKLEEQQAIEKRFEESQSRFESIFNQSMLGNKIIDPDLKIMQVNEALQKMLGYTTADLIGTRITSFSHPDFISQWEKLQKSLWEEKIPAFQIETCLLKKDGTYLWCQVSSTLFQDQGVSLGYTIVEDISNRRSLELELKRQYDHQETIMHMVAHDLKSPLNNIKLAAGFLDETIQEIRVNEKENQQEALTFVNIISETTQQALSIIDDLLLIGEIESVATPPQEKTDLKAFIQNFLNSLAPAVQNKSLQIKLLSPTEPIYVVVDPDKFRRVLENIVSNAIKFSKINGLVTITLNKEGEKVQIQIQDNGIGIPDKLKATIFNKFTSSKRPGTQGEPTTGLGLYIVKQVVEKQGGKIWLESQENVGTTIYIQLNSI